MELKKSKKKQDGDFTKSASLESASLKSDYKFIWGNYHPHWTIEANMYPFMNLRNIVWNKINKIIEVSRNNNIECYHSIEDLKDDREKGKLFLDKEYREKFDQDVKTICNGYKKLFKKIKTTKLSKRSNYELLDLFIEVIRNWSLVISYFRASQVEPTYYLNEEIKKHLSKEEADLLVLSSDLDQANKELIAWQNVLKGSFSTDKLIKHAEEFPWIVAAHFTFQDVINTLTQRYNYDQEHLKFKDPADEKKQLRKKQEKILSKKHDIREIVEFLQKMAFGRMELKSCWAGTDFYLIPLFEEISKRTGENVRNLYAYYLSYDLSQLLKEEKKLSSEEIKNRQRCFVGLLKNSQVTYYSGDEAENIAKAELKELCQVPKINELRGAIANQGKIIGVAKILYANNIEQLREMRQSFQKGDILITQMTQPNVMDIASRAGAIVTEEGGMLSHAAIIAREFGIPCIVGTEIATKVFKDGDLVEVDADKGVVRKIR